MERNEYLTLFMIMARLYQQWILPHILFILKNGDPSVNTEHLQTLAEQKHEFSRDEP